MRALEFEALISNGMIKIPQNMPQLENIKTRVVLLYPADMPDMQTDKTQLMAAFQQLEDKNAFRDMTDSVEWQKGLRDEWE